MKKGQMEMVGLAVIVVILILAFVLFLTLDRGQETSSVTARESLYANNLLNAIMLYSLDRGSVSDYITNCFEYTRLSELQQADQSDIDKKETYCNEPEDKIKEIMNGVLRANQESEVLFENNCGDINNINLGTCGDTYIAASPYYIRTKGGTCRVKLRLC